MSDYTLPDAYKEARPTARKDHDCIECSKGIDHIDDGEEQGA